MHKRIYTYVEKTMTVIKDDANSVYLMDYPIDEDEKNTHLWESVGALKYALRESITPMRAMSDHNVKKWVFGRKNAHISNLVSAFECKTGIDLHDTFNIKRTKTLRPQIQNIVNCYWLYSYVNHNQKEIGRKVIL
ncbi:hypothetical protein SALB1_3497 [Salinisphaera sp. LB1]|nr:hypothetical protein SALB1_3497 [Salinisphaera sp. LB1]